MNKEQLISKVAQKRRTPYKVVRNCLNDIIEVLVEAFESDTNVAITGLGTFQVKKRAPTKRILPNNGKGPGKGGDKVVLTVPEKRCIKFNPSPHINRYYSENPPHNSQPERKSSEK